MAIEHVSAVLHGCFGVDVSAKMVLLIIAEHARRGQRAVAYPSVARLARIACLHERQVQYLLRELAAAGWLIIENGGGRHRPNLYHLNIERMHDNIKKGCSTVQGNDTEKGAPQCRVSEDETVQPSAPHRTDKRCTEPVDNPEKGCTGTAERVHCTAPEPVLTGTSMNRFSRTHAHAPTREDHDAPAKPIDKRPPPEPRSKPGRGHRIEKTPEELETEKRRQLDALAKLKSGRLQ
jgi:hypothetical protein